MLFPKILSKKTPGKVKLVFSMRREVTIDVGKDVETQNRLM